MELQVSVKNTSIFAWLGFICVQKSHYDDYIATKKQSFIKKSEKINIFDISIYQKVKYRNIDIEKIPVLIDISIYRNSLLTSCHSDANPASCNSDLYVKISNKK